MKKKLLKTNIKKYLNSDKNEVTLYHKNGKEAIIFNESDGYWSEKTYDNNGNELTFKNSNGYWSERTYDNNGNELTYKDSDGFWTESTYDNNGNKLTFKNSNRYWYESTYDNNGNKLTYKDSYGDSKNYIQEMTLEEVCKELGKTIKIVKG